MLSMYHITKVYMYLGPGGLVGRNSSSATSVNSSHEWYKMLEAILQICTAVQEIGNMPPSMWMYCSAL